MKNLTRVLALVIVLAMMMSTVAFASFTDVAADDDYAEAIETLAALGIIKGYEDGTFGADKAITRAEAVAIVNRIQNLSLAASGAAGASLYTDVAADHWALGDINLATQMGVISGDGNGLFRPEDQVSYQEMVKMLTTALGYGPAVAENGGWPTGYLVVAQNKGVLADTVNGGATAANRGVVAQLTFNALTAPIMEQTGYGDDKEYHFIDHNDGYTYTKTLLDQKLDIYKVAVAAVANDSLAISGTVAEPGYVKVNLLADAYFDVNIPTDLAGNFTWLKADSDLGDQLAYQAIAYVKKNAEKKYEVLYSTVDAIANKTLTVPADEIVSISAGVITTEDEDGVKERYYIDPNADNYDSLGYVNKTTVIRNNAFSEDGDTLTVADFTYDGVNVLDNDVTFLYNDNDDDIIDYVFIKQYATDVVSEVSHNGKTIVGKQALLNLDTTANKKLVYTLTLDGEEVTPADLQEGDVFSYIESNSRNAYEIIATRSSVEGTIDAYSPSKLEWTINGEVYEESQSAVANGMNTKLQTTPGVAGVFYLDGFGKIAYFEKAATNGAVAAANFGLVKNFGLTSNSALGKKAGVELLKADGTTEQIVLANKVTIVTTALDLNGDVADSSVVYDSIGTGAGFSGGADANINDTIEAALAQGALVDYSVNTAGLLSQVTVSAASVYSKRDDVYFTQYEANDIAAAMNAGLDTILGTADDVINTSNANYKTYSENQEKLGGLTVTENTLVFYVGEANQDDWTVTGKSFFEDATGYVAIPYCVNTDKEIGALVIESKHQTGIVKDAAAVFAAASTVKNDEGVTVTQYAFYQNGELKTMNLDSYQGALPAGLKIGVPFWFNVNANGEIVAGTITALTSGNFAGYAEPALVPGTAAYYAFGQVIERSGNALKLGGFIQQVDGDYLWESHNIPETANVYVVDFSGRTPSIAAGAMTDIVKNRYFTTNYMAAGTDTLFGTGDDVATKVVRLVDGDVADNFTVLIKFNDEMDITDVIAYKNNSTDATETLADVNSTVIEKANIVNNYFGAISF